MDALSSPIPRSHGNVAARFGCKSRHRVFGRGSPGPLSPPPRAHRRPPSKECVDGRAVFAHPEITRKRGLRKLGHGQAKFGGFEMCGQAGCVNFRGPRD